jgi:hypothetical protein
MRCLHVVAAIARHAAQYVLGFRGRCLASHLLPNMFWNPTLSLVTICFEFHCKTETKRPSYRQLSRHVGDKSRRISQIRLSQTATSHATEAEESMQRQPSNTACFDSISQHERQQGGNRSEQSGEAEALTQRLQAIRQALYTSKRGGKSRF